MTYTYTYAVLRVSERVYDEIRKKLREAGYEDQFHYDGHEEVIDMHGLAIGLDVTETV